MFEEDSRNPLRRVNKMIGTGRRGYAKPLEINNLSINIKYDIILLCHLISISYRGVKV